MNLYFRSSLLVFWVFAFVSLAFVKPGFADNQDLKDCHLHIEQLMTQKIYPALWRDLVQIKVPGNGKFELTISPGSDKYNLIRVTQFDSRRKEGVLNLDSNLRILTYTRTEAYLKGPHRVDKDCYHSGDCAARLITDVESLKVMAQRLADGSKEKKVVTCLIDFDKKAINEILLNLKQKVDEL